MSIEDIKGYFQGDSMELIITGILMATAAAAAAIGSAPVLRPVPVKRK